MPLIDHLECCCEVCFDRQFNFQTNSNSSVFPILLNFMHFLRASCQIAITCAITSQFALYLSTVLLSGKNDIHTLIR